MKKIREDWAVCTYEDLVDYIQPTKFIVESTKYNDKFKTPVLTAGKSFIKGYTNEEFGIFDNLPVIIFDDFTTASQFVNFKFKVKSSAMKILVPTNSEVSLTLIFYSMQVDRIRSDTHKRYWISVYAKKKIQLPPLPEQRAIVTKIEQLFSELDNGVLQMKKAQAQLKIYRQAVLKQAFEGKLTEAWRKKQGNALPSAKDLLQQIKTAREQHLQKQIEDWKIEVKNWEAAGKEGKKPGKPRALKELPELDEKLIRLPNSWTHTRLVEITSKVSDGPFGSNLKSSDYVGEGVRVIRLENIKNLYFEDSKKSFVTAEKYEILKKHTVLPDDIIFSTFISEQTKVVRLPKSVEFAINKADCVCIRVLKSTSVKYLEFYLSTVSVYNQLVNQVHGATRPRVNTTQLKLLTVPLCSLEEQTQIVQEIETRLSVCDSIEKTIAENLEKSEALRQSILKKAFEGRLLSAAELAACRAEADWEPAERLLERIKAEKESTKKSKEK